MQDQIINVTVHFNDVDKLRVDTGESYVTVNQDHVTLFFEDIEHAYRFAKKILSELDDIEWKAQWAEGLADAKELGY